MKIDPNAPAYPLVYDLNDPLVVEPGMTIRLKLAAEFAKPWLASYPLDKGVLTEADRKTIVDVAFVLADDMIERANRDEPND